MSAGTTVGRLPGQCTTCGGPVTGERAVHFPAGGGCCDRCVREYRSDSPPRVGAKTGPKRKAAETTAECEA